jgi:hypothetical protein
LLAHGRWFTTGTPASSTTKTGRHDITEILLNVALKHKKSNQILSVPFSTEPTRYNSRFISSAAIFSFATSMSTSHGMTQIPILVL